MKIKDRKLCVLVLAGGKGKSMFPVKTNKTVLPFFGQPLLWYVMKILEQAGLQNFFAVANQENRKFFHDRFIPLVEQSLTQGMGQAILLAARAKADCRLLIVDGVKLVDPLALKVVVDQLLTAKSIFLTGRKVDNFFVGGYLDTCGRRVKKIIEKPPSGSFHPDLAKLVFDYFPFPQRIISAINEVSVKRDDQYERAINILAKKTQINWLSYDGPWQKIKFAPDILTVLSFLFNSFFQEGRGDGVEISPAATITGKVYLDEDAKIFPGAVVVGPAYIGKGVIIGNNALVRESTVEENSVVGFGSEVVRSYIGPNCKIHHSFVGDSILENAVNLSYGVCLTNLRIDGKPINFRMEEKKQIPTQRKKFGAVVGRNVFIGAQTTVMPGIAIGENAKIFPRSVVKTSVQANCRYKEGF